MGFSGTEWLTSGIWWCSTNHQSQAPVGWQSSWEWSKHCLTLAHSESLLPTSGHLISWLPTPPHPSPLQRAVCQTRMVSFCPQNPFIDMWQYYWMLDKGSAESGTSKSLWGWGVRQGCRDLTGCEHCVLLLPCQIFHTHGLRVWIPHSHFPTLVSQWHFGVLHLTLGHFWGPFASGR